MRTNEYFFNGQITVLLIILFPLITVMSSCQKDKTLDLDITMLDWELKSIKQDGTIHNAALEDIYKPDSYILRFESETIFQLDFSINTGKGEYEIITNGEISIISYTNITRAAMTDYDNILLSVLKQMTTYTVRGKTLTFKGNNSEVKFKKK